MRTVKDFDLNGKKVILRCDLNVTIKDGEIVDNTKIKASLKTIEYILNQNARLIIMSHLGRIKTEKDKKENDMIIVYEELNRLLPDKVEFVDETNPTKLKKYVDKIEKGHAILIQNTRYEDLKGNKESECDKKLSKGWAELGNIFINDAFATIHRKHASNYGIASYLTSGIGFLLMEELENLNILDKPKRPFVVVMGGAKIKDKIGIVQALIKKADYILIGGALSYTFLKAKGYNLGKCPVETDEIDYCKDLLDIYEDKIILPSDLYGTYEKTDDTDIAFQSVENIPDNFNGLDIGDKTAEEFISILKNAKTVFWNGPLGAYEYEKFRLGTKKVLKYAKDNVDTVILGGGDIVGCSNLLGYTDDLKFASTGGGATLKYLENHDQPGLRNME